MSTINSIIIVFCIVFTGYTLYEEYKFQKDIKSQGATVRCIKRAKKETLLYGIGIAVSAVISAICFYGGKKYMDTAVLFLVVITLCISMLINENRSSRLYYTNKGFFLQEGFISFKKISRIDFNKKSSALIILQDGNEIKVSRKKAEAISNVRK